MLMLPKNWLKNESNVITVSTGKAYTNIVKNFANKRTKKLLRQTIFIKKQAVTTYALKNTMIKP